MSLSPFEDRIGRSLVKLLRHTGRSMGLIFSPDGFILLSDALTAINQPNVSFDTIKKIVDVCPKQRMKLENRDGEWMIRANQGHTIREVQDEFLLTKILIPDEIPVCVHGTYSAFLPSILKVGLKAMKRNHIHFAKGISGEDGVITGMRSTCDVHIYINVAQAMEDGIEFYISENGAILTSGADGVLDPKYFQHVDKLSKKCSPPQNVLKIVQQSVEL